nr:hypothetical protein CFP56_74292 [Quercus suber]
MMAIYNSLFFKKTLIERTTCKVCASLLDLGKYFIILGTQSLKEWVFSKCVGPPHIIDYLENLITPSVLRRTIDTDQGWQSEI